MKKSTTTSSTKPKSSASKTKAKNKNQNQKNSMDKFKYEVANELGVPLKDGYNGDLTSAQNGSVGGEMVKKMIDAQKQQMSK